MLLFTCASVSVDDEGRRERGHDSDAHGREQHRDRDRVHKVPACRKMSKYLKVIKVCFNQNVLENVNTNSIVALPAPGVPSGYRALTECRLRLELQP